MTVTARKIPALRFPEFEGEWEEKRLEDISKGVMYGMNSAAIPFDGVNKYLRITDIDEESRAFVPNPLTSPEGKIENKYKLKEGDIVFTRTGASTGKSYLFRETDGNLYFAGFLIKFSILKAIPYFVYSSTFRSSYLKWVQVMSMRSGQPGINAEEYKSLKISLPLLPEQQKIATFLTIIDTRIQQLSRKKAMLEQYKKGVMQQIFAQETRFKDEEGKEFSAWAESTLGKLASFIKGKGISKADIAENGNWECVLYGELYTSYGEVIDNIQSRTNLDPSNLVLSQANDVVIPASGETHIDIATASCILREGIALGGDLNIIRANANGIFLAYYLNNARKNQIARLAQGSSVIHLYSSQLKLLRLSLPSLPEQQKIAAFLSTIDRQINLVGQQLERMQAFKKGLLQQMFV